VGRSADGSARPPLDAGSALHLRKHTQLNATDLVVDLGAVETITTDGAQELVAIGAFVRTRNDGFWIAAPRSRGDGYTLRPIQEDGPDGLVGLSVTLDDALAGATT
jgi:hypothetical protein